MKKKIIIAFLILLFLITSISFATDLQDNNLSEDQNDDDLNVPDDSQNLPDTQPIDIKIEKIWVDNNDENGLRPDNLSFHLEYNGVPLTPVFILNSTDNWKYTFVYDGSDSLPDDAKLVEEDVPEGYECNVSGDLKHGFVVTNTLKNNDTDNASSNENTQNQAPLSKGSSNDNTQTTQDNTTDASSKESNTNNTKTTENNTTNAGSKESNTNNTKTTQQANPSKNTTSQTKNVTKDKPVNATQTVPPEPKKPDPKFIETGYPIILLVIAAVGLVIAYKLRKKE